MKLTPKETSLLNDLKTHEQLCVEKYGKYTEQACDGVLKNLFNSIGSTEKEHLTSITSIQSGTVPSTSGSSKSEPATTGPVHTDSQSKQIDSFLCQDMLSTEKHVSSVYNTSIFEFTDTSIRDVLNHIQKEEQKHGEQIYSYMQSHGMYS